MLRVKTLTAAQIIELIDRSVKETAKDVREGRVPLDGRARMPSPKPVDEPAEEKSAIIDAAE